MSDIQTVFRHFYPLYKERYGVSAQQEKVANNIMNCKTEVMGYNSCTCESCESVVVHYNSCRDRHCPCCQAIEKEIWADKKLESVIEAPYFHLVFTVPEELRLLIFQNQRLLYILMYKATKETITELALDKKYLGAQVGFFSVLHTWGNDLRYHPHLHVVVMAGGLTKHKHWRQSAKKFFIPVKVLSKVFRGKFLHHLKQYQKQLSFYGTNKEIDFEKLLGRCYKVNWYTYARKTFSGPLALIRYLGRYTHRIAISNTRIVAVDKETVTFSVFEKGKRKKITLTGVEFIRRFMMHLLPKGFVKLRSYGLLSNRNQKTKLALCRLLTGSLEYKSVFTGKSKTEILSIILGKDITICPFCQKARMIRNAFWSLKPI